MLNYVRYIAVFMVTLLVSLFSDSQPVAGQPTRTTIPHLTTEQWRQDLQYLALELPKRHKNAFHYTSKAAFLHAVQSLNQQLPQLSDVEATVALQRIVSLVGDGHTFLNIWEVTRYFPLDVFWFGKELRVIRADARYPNTLGARITRIGDVPVEEAWQRLNKLIPQRENQWFVLHRGQDQFMRAEILQALGIIPDVEHASFTLEKEGQSPYKMEIASLATSEKASWVPVVAMPAALYLQHPERSFWFARVPTAERTVYVSFRGYDSLAHHARQLVQFLDARPTDRLIVDMRQNGGGNFSLPRKYLLPALRKRKNLNTKGHLFVITGRKTFSAGMSNAADFRRLTAATLVGEPTGARPNGYQELYFLTLPNSKLRVGISIRYYQFQPQDADAVFPDQRIDPDWKSYQLGIDPVVDWIMRQPI